MEGIVCGMEISMEYISDVQAKQMILEVGRRMYQGGFVAANDGNISCKVGITRSGRHPRESRKAS